MIYSFILVDKKTQRVLRQFRGSLKFAESMSKDYQQSTLYIVGYPQEGEVFNPMSPVRLEVIS